MTTTQLSANSRTDRETIAEPSPSGSRFKLTGSWPESLRPTTVALEARDGAALTTPIEKYDAPAPIYHAPLRRE